MKTLESIISGLLDAQLKEAYDEIVEWHKDGVLKMDGVVRKVRNEFNEANGMDFMMHGMEAPILFEIVKRHYEARSPETEESFDTTGVKRCIREEIISFTYDTPEQRLSHVRYMQSKGWDNDSQVRRLKEGHSVWDSSNKDAYECFARFYKSY